MSHSIKHLFNIDAKKSDVFKALTSIEGIITIGGQKILQEIAMLEV